MGSPSTPALEDLKAQSVEGGAQVLLLWKIELVLEPKLGLNLLVLGVHVFHGAHF